MKRGDTLDLIVLLPDSLSPSYFLGWTPRSEIQLDRDRRVELGVAWADADPNVSRTQLQLSSAPEETATWPLGRHPVDIRFERDADGFTWSTETFVLLVEGEVTR